ncbi:MAG: hypothetical protein AAGP08_14860 [Pseudomonadota bacterium]
MALTDPFAHRPKALAALPRIVRIFILHAIIGYSLGAVFTAGVLYYDIAGVGGLVARVDGGWLAAFIFFMLNGSVFAGVQTAITVMSMDYDDDDDDQGGGHRPPLLRAHVPVPVRVNRGPRR